MFIKHIQKIMKEYNVCLCMVRSKWLSATQTGTFFFVVVFVSYSSFYSVFYIYFYLNSWQKLIAVWILSMASPFDFPIRANLKILSVVFFPVSGRYRCIIPVCSSTSYVSVGARHYIILKSSVVQLLVIKHWFIFFNWHCIWPLNLHFEFLFCS